RDAREGTGARGHPPRRGRTAGALLRARGDRLRRGEPGAGRRAQRARAGARRPARAGRAAHRARGGHGGAADRGWRGAARELGREPRLGAGRPARRAGAHGRHGTAGACAGRGRAGGRRAPLEDHRGAPLHDAFRARDRMTGALERAALAPAALAYGAVAALRNRLYDAGWLDAARVPAHVVSVGNLAVGGTGKTPTALWLAERLAARGLRTGIVARGYRKRRRGVVIVGEDGRPLVDPEEGGDEAVLLARRFAGPVVTGERRAEAAAVACARFALDALVLDDGFQHRALV